MATIAENLQTIIDIKADIKTAIENKGVTVGDAGFGEYAGKIDSISQGVSSWALPDGTKFTDGPTEYPALFFEHLTTCENMFSNCTSLITVPLFDTENVINMNRMFYNCESLKNFPQFNTENVQMMASMVEGCISLTDMPLLNCASVREFGPALSNARNIKTIAGFKDIGASFGLYYEGTQYTGALALQFGDLSVLTYDSAVNIINYAYDLNNNTNLNDSELSWCVIYFNNNVYNQLSTEDIAIATSKGWSVISVQ